jgi:Spy/CpxP family protein refolding chaperone
MFSSRSLTLVFALMLIICTSVFAQDPQPVTPGQGDLRRPDRVGRIGRLRSGRRIGHEGRIGPGLRALEGELALTASQREQLRAIHQRQFESTKAQREELFQIGEKRRAGTLTDADRQRAQELHRQFREMRTGIKSEVQNILTPEQRSKIQESWKERKVHREEKMLLRELRETRPE